MSKSKKDIFITKSESWSIISNTNIGEVLSDTIAEFQAKKEAENG